MEDRNKAIKEIVKAITGIFSSNTKENTDSPSNRTAYAVESIYEDHGELLEKNNEVMNSTDEILGDIYEDHGSTLEGILEELKKSNDEKAENEEEKEAEIEEEKKAEIEEEKDEESSEDTPSATLDESSDEPSVMDILYEAQGISTTDSGKSDKDGLLADDSGSGTGGDSPIEVLQEGIAEIVDNTQEVADKKNPILEAGAEILGLLTKSFLPAIVGITALVGLIATFKDEILNALKFIWDFLKGVFEKLTGGIVGAIFGGGDDNADNLEEGDEEAEQDAASGSMNALAGPTGIESMNARREAALLEEEENDTTTASSLMPEASVSGPEQTSRSVATNQVEEAGQEINQPPVIVNNVSAPTNNNVVSGGESSSPTTAIVTARETHSSYMRFQQRRMNRVL